VLARRAASWGEPTATSAVTASDTAGFAARPVKQGVVSVELSTGPASAVPIEAPRLGPGLDAADLDALLVRRRRRGGSEELRRPTRRCRVRGATSAT
jgi:hypothetical protein